MGQVTPVTDDSGACHPAWVGRLFDLIFMYEMLEAWLQKYGDAVGEA